MWGKGAGLEQTEMVFFFYHAFYATGTVFNGVIRYSLSEHFFDLIFTGSFMH